MKVLLVEDETDLLQLLRTYLWREGYRVEEATTFKEAYRKLISYEYDAVLIDLNLPDGDGLELIRLIRQEDYPTGILITSVRGDIEERVRGLEYGADDYLVKPFHLSELNARIKAVWRRKSVAPGKLLEAGELSVQPDQRIAKIGAETLNLTRKEFDILLFLLRNRNRVVPKESIAEHLWGDYMDEAVSYDFIYAHVKNLRKKLAKKGGEDYVRTVYGIGYKLQWP